MKKKTPKPTQKEEKRVQGIAASPGITQGPAFLFFRNEPPIPMRDLDPNEIPVEVDRFLAAIEKAKQEIENLRKEYIENTGGVQEGIIFEAHTLILEDPTLIEKTISNIEKTSRNAEYCFSIAADDSVAMFSSMKNEFFRERMYDIQDVKRRILRNLMDYERVGLKNLKRKVIVVAHDLGPTDTATMDKKKVQAFLTEVGGPTSHSVIIARSLGIPAVVGLNDVLGRVQESDYLIVDGSDGLVIINPTSETKELYYQKQDEYEFFEKSLKTLKDKPSITKDGFQIELSANIESIDEINAVIQCGARGVGLFRTEFICLQKGAFPTEKEQYQIYSTAVKSLNPNTVIIRTYDLGGDKLPILNSGGHHENNPFLGWRAIRFCLDHPLIFKDQIRAILRAGVHGAVKIMIPFISNTEEVIRSRRYIAEVEEELNRDNIPHGKDYELGVMVETPSAAISADILAPLVDFFSIGTNDLTQYLLAVDRGNEKIADLYDPLNPAIIRMIHQTIVCGHQHGIWVGVCGEMASHPMVAYLLIGLGADELSTSPIFVPEIKRLIRAISFIEARQIANEVLKMNSALTIRDFLLSKLKQVFAPPNKNQNNTNVIM